METVETLYVGGGSPTALPLDLGFVDDRGREVRLGEYFDGDRPVILTDYPASIKPFYMRLSDDERTVAAMDVLARSGMAVYSPTARAACHRRAMTI